MGLCHCMLQPAFYQLQNLSSIHCFAGNLIERLHPDPIGCIPATPMIFNNNVNLTDQFMLKAGCKNIYTKQSVAGMHLADKLDDISLMKYDFHTCHGCFWMPQASRRNFHEQCIYTDIVGYHQSLGHSWDGDCRTWKNWWYCNLLQLDTMDRIIDVLLIGASPSSAFWVSASHHQSKQSQYRAYLWKKSLLLKYVYIPVHDCWKVLLCFNPVLMEETDEVIFTAKIKM